ncbi:hypothetical protein [Stenotrophomonas sp. 24(2023)]|uniref:hypothetical protein n=1 Tax=Stenotrophomonas sp. 24(2023) TaxID=3068324 RepID=UPI0027E10CA8|nr:hypothetical protein [Stenotrophomonas sp. 24(2023)]WMJ69881.1 hypothetical protein Q9R17_01865 [Stenotrophomonas sp. 24(2023)]
MSQRHTGTAGDASPGKSEGVQESRQDRKQEQVARQRPGQRDQQVHDANTRRPARKDGGQGTD